MEPIRIIRWEGLGILVLIFALVMYKAAGSREWWREVLRLEELQLLLVTVVVSAKVVIDLMTGPGGTMPAVGAGWLVLFGASAAVYGVMKGLRMMRTR